MAINIILDDSTEIRKVSNALHGRIYVTDLKHRAFFCSMEWHENKELYLDPPTDKPIAIHIRFDVPNFGLCWVTMDNCGSGYTLSTKHYSLMEEVINSRIARVERRLQDPFLGGMRAPLLEQAKKEFSHGNKQEAFRLAILAGEDVEFQRAKNILANPSYRTNVLFSGTFFGERLGDFAIGVGKDWDNDTPPPDFLRPRDLWDNIAEVMDATTLPTFWRWIEPVRGKYHFELLDQIVTFCKDRSILMKSFAIYWGGIGGSPKWFRSLDLKHQLLAIKEWTKVIVDRYGEHIQVYEAVNEMHDHSFANPMRYGHEELMEITACVCQWLGEMAPGKTRVINHCCPWGEYSQEFQADNWVPLTFLEEVIKQKIEFEGIGIQYYNPGWDMMELGSHIDRFETFGKLLFITEMGTPSAAGDDAAVETGQIDPMNGWRGTWNEDRQADWIEILYTIAMARESMRTINYWDVDDKRAFVSHAGLFDRKGNPKPSFERLRMLKEKYLTG